MDDLSPSQDEWDELGKRDAAKAREREAAAAGSFQVAPSQVAGSSAQGVRMETSTTSPAGQEARCRSAPPGGARGEVVAFDQYGSNITRTGPWPLPLSVLESLRARATGDRKSVV